jgi:hypothetical protein
MVLIAESATQKAKQNIGSICIEKPSLAHSKIGIIQQSQLPNLGCV